MESKTTAIAPGMVLLEEFMQPLNISQNKLARDLDVPVARVNEIIKAKRAITTDTALRLAVYFETTPEFWLSLQNAYELKLAEETLLPRITRDVRPHAGQ